MSGETLRLVTTQGDVVIRLRPDLAPNHVARFTELAKEGAYDGVIFHRVIRDFMAQTGDVRYGNSESPDFDIRRVGTGGSGKADLAAEFNDAKHVRGTVSTARTANPNSANSQFFICFSETPWLNRQYTVWGEVIEGMENVDKLAHGEPPANPDKIVKAIVE